MALIFRLFLFPVLSLSLSGNALSQEIITDRMEITFIEEPGHDSSSIVIRHHYKRWYKVTYFIDDDLYCSRRIHRHRIEKCKRVFEQSEGKSADWDAREKVIVKFLMQDKSLSKGYLRGSSTPSRLKHILKIWK